MLPRERCGYVMGNPPFVGKHYQSAEQRADMVHVFGDFSNTGDLDYVTCWYVKAARYSIGANAETPGTRVPQLPGSARVPRAGEQLFRLYEQLTAPLLPAMPKTRARRSLSAPPAARPRWLRTPGLPGASAESGE